MQQVHGICEDAIAVVKKEIAKVTRELEAAGVNSFGRLRWRRFPDDHFTT
jgi:hypothetical protein